MTNTNEDILVFHASSTFPGIFGDPTIIVTARSNNANQYNGEYFTMYYDNDPKMQTGKLSFNSTNIPAELFTVNIKFILDETFQSALIGYREILAQTYPQTLELNLFSPPFEIIPIEKAHIARLWMRNKFHPQLSDICQLTSCHELHSFLSEVKSLPIITTS